MNRGADGDYSEAIRLANEVIGSAEFGMEDTYADIFQHGYDSKELLFTRFMKNPPAMDDNVGICLKCSVAGLINRRVRILRFFRKRIPGMK